MKVKSESEWEREWKKTGQQRQQQHTTYKIKLTLMEGNVVTKSKVYLGVRACLPLFFPPSLLLSLILSFSISSSEKNEGVNKSFGEGERFNPNVNGGWMFSSFHIICSKNRRKRTNRFSFFPSQLPFSSFISFPSLQRVREREREMVVRKGMETRTGEKKTKHNKTVNESVDHQRKGSNSSRVSFSR